MKTFLAFLLLALSCAAAVTVQPATGTGVWALDGTNEHWLTERTVLPAREWTFVATNTPTTNVLTAVPSLDYVVTVGIDGFDVESRRSMDWMFLQGLFWGVRVVAVGILVRLIQYVWAGLSARSDVI